MLQLNGLNCVDIKEIMLHLLYRVFQKRMKSAYNTENILFTL
jgi:hypothetical protein